MHLEKFDHTTVNEASDVCEICIDGNDICQEAIIGLAEDCAVKPEWIAEMIWHRKLSACPGPYEISQLVNKYENMQI